MIDSLPGVPYYNRGARETRFNNKELILINNRSCARHGPRAVENENVSNDYRVPANESRPIIVV